MKSMEIECVDDSNLLDYPTDSNFQPALGLSDDYFAITEGVEEYFRPVWNQMSAAWDRIPHLQHTFTPARAAVVASRVQRPLREGKRVLCRRKMIMSYLRKVEMSY